MKCLTIGDERRNDRLGTGGIDPKSTECPDCFRESAEGRLVLATAIVAGFKGERPKPIGRMVNYVFVKNGVFRFSIPEESTLSLKIGE